MVVVSRSRVVILALVVLCAMSLFIFTRETEYPSSRLRTSIVRGGITTGGPMPTANSIRHTSDGEREDIRMALFCLERSGSTW